MLISITAQLLQGGWVPKQDAAVLQRHRAAVCPPVQDPADGDPADGHRSRNVLLGALDRPAGGRVGEEVPGDPPLRRPKGHGVQLLGQQAHRPCQVLHHGQGQLRISGYRLGGQLPVDGDQLTGGEGHGGGDPGSLSKKDASPNRLPAG